MRSGAVRSGAVRSGAVSRSAAETMSVAETTSAAREIKGGDNLLAPKAGSLRKPASWPTLLTFGLNKKGFTSKLALSTSIPEGQCMNQ